MGTLSIEMTLLLIGASMVAGALVMLAVGSIRARVLHPPPKVRESGGQEELPSFEEFVTPPDLGELEHEHREALAALEPKTVGWRADGGEKFFVLSSVREDPFIGLPEENRIISDETI